MNDEQIGPRRPYWADYVYDPRIGSRHLREWRRQIRYGEARFMSSTLRQEFIKVFEQYTHLCSGLGESAMQEIVAAYFRRHPERRFVNLDYRAMREAPAPYYGHTEAIPRRR